MIGVSSGVYAGIKMKHVKLVIFDLDGTLVNAYPAIIRSFNYAMRHSGYPPQDDLIIRRAVGWGDEFLLKPFLKPKDLRKVLVLYRRHHRMSLLKYSRIYPGSRKVLSYLESKGLKLAVASNRPTEFSLILIRHLRLKRYFDFVLCADRLNYSKPHPEILNKIMRKFTVTPKETVYVGDMAIDAQAGRRAGIFTVIVTTGSSALPEIKKERPNCILRGISELAKVI
jgi:phosphoglycolate phosphatase